MTTQTGAMPATHFRRGWIYVLTLSLVTINYMDRSALGVVAQAVRTEFKLSPVEMGYLFSSFFWSYVVFLLPIGIMLDRYSTRTINSVGIVVWSLAMAATAGVWSFGTLIVARSDLDSVLRPHRARMDAGPGARRRHRVLERR
jgi:MFS family permease